MVLLGGEEEEEGQIGGINSSDKKINQSHPSLSLFANAEARKYRRFPLVAVTSQPTAEGGEDFVGKKKYVGFFFKLFTFPHRICMSIQWARPNDKLRL